MTADESPASSLEWTGLFHPAQVRNRRRPSRTQSTGWKVEQLEKQRGRKHAWLVVGGYTFRYAAEHGRRGRRPPRWRPSSVSFQGHPDRRTRRNRSTWPCCRWGIVLGSALVRFASTTRHWVNQHTPIHALVLQYFDYYSCRLFVQLRHWKEDGGVVVHGWSRDGPPSMEVQDEQYIISLVLVQ